MYAMWFACPPLQVKFTRYPTLTKFNILVIHRFVLGRACSLTPSAQPHLEGRAQRLGGLGQAVAGAEHVGQRGCRCGPEGGAHLVRARCVHRALRAAQSARKVAAPVHSLSTVSQDIGGLKLTQLLKTSLVLAY